MRTNSLAFRLFFWAAGLTVAILIITGVVLSSLYRSAVERAFDRRLDVYLRTLVADVASPEEGTEKFSAVDRRAVVRVAAVRMVLAGYAPRCGQAGGAFLALVMGFKSAAIAGERSAGGLLGRISQRLCIGSRGRQVTPGP